MSILGIISEYNPFHNGHSYHLLESKKSCGADKCICVMGGNFLQRGLPALYDKYIRTKLALLSGIDLVIELPTYYAINSAEYFASYSIKLLNSLNILDYLSFGTEENDLSNLQNIATILSNETEEFSRQLNLELKTGITFAKARQNALVSITQNDKYIDIFNKPNNILAIEYLKALKKYNSKISPINILRKSANYLDNSFSTTDICSATAIYEQLYKSKNISDIKKYISNDAYNILSTCTPKFLTDFEKEIIFLIRKMDLNELENILEVTEGLENRLKKYAYLTNNIHELISLLNTKRFTQTKIQRILIHILLSMTKTEFMQIENGSYDYIHVLGFNSLGEQLLKEISTKSTIPIITSIKKYMSNNPNNLLLNKDCLSSNLYMQKYNIDFTSPIIKI